MTGPESAFSLVWIQPVKPQQQLVTQYLKFLNLRQLIVLQAGWLGRMLLPEWKSRPEGDLAVNSQLLWLLSTGVGWSTQDTAFGNLSSLWWGIAARRFQAIHRPDLADRCNARMRHHLHPAAARTSPAYLTIRRAIRETTPAQSA